MSVIATSQVASSMFALILDAKTPTLCWDASTIFAGAQLALHDCNPVAATQAFHISNDTTGASVLSVAVDATTSLCVDGQSNVLTLAACDNTRASQKFKFGTDGSFGTVSTSTTKSVCFGPDRNQLISQTQCSKAAKTIKSLQSVDPPYSLAPYAVTQLQIGGLCLDGSNVNGLKGSPCADVASQKWYHLWGQIRNVENGLCMDAPKADGSINATSSIKVQLSPCYTFPPSDTMLWTKLPDNSLQNGQSANCIHLDTDKSIVLGTNLCGKDDKLVKTPKIFSGVEHFVSYLPNSHVDCASPVERKDIRDLTPTELQDFFKGMDTLRKIPSLMGRANRYIDYVSLHAIAVGWIHGTPQFLSWHRYFIAVLEDDLRKVLNNPTFAFPYWAWGTSASNWYEPSVGVLTPAMLGTTGTGPSNCVTDGFMKGSWIPSNGLPCLVRSYNATTANSTAESVASYSESFLLTVTKLDIITNSAYKDFNNFRLVAEG
ncbi:hypothetical protein HDU76_012594, partial [Blyttiomyces sp. JEL0837]